MKRSTIPTFLAILAGFILISCDQSTDNQLQIEGLQEPVEIIRDEWGINHIYAKNQHDLFFAQGYAAAKDRLFQFEIWRRQATGTVAEILGERELKRDIGTRLFKYRGDLTGRTESLSCGWGRNHQCLHPRRKCLYSRNPSNS